MGSDAQLQADIADEALKRDLIKGKCRHAQEQSLHDSEVELDSLSDARGHSELVAGPSVEEVEALLFPKPDAIDNVAALSSTPVLGAEVVRSGEGPLRHDGQELNAKPRGDVSAPWLYVNIPRLPRVARRHDHGIPFFHKWLIPSSNMDSITLVTLREGMAGMQEQLQHISVNHTTPIEVIASGDRPGGYAYLGSFMPTRVWSSFKEGNIDDVSELFGRCASIPDSKHTDVLREEWLGGLTGNYVFCKLLPAGFNVRFVYTITKNTSRKRKRYQGL